MFTAHKFHNSINEKQRMYTKMSGNTSKHYTDIAYLHQTHILTFVFSSRVLWFIIIQNPNKNENTLFKNLHRVFKRKTKRYIKQKVNSQLSNTNSYICLIYRWSMDDIYIYTYIYKEIKKRNEPLKFVICNRYITGCNVQFIALVIC